MANLLKDDNELEERSPTHLSQSLKLLWAQMALGESRNEPPQPKVLAHRAVSCFIPLILEMVSYIVKGYFKNVTGTR